MRKGGFREVLGVGISFNSKWYVFVFSCFCFFVCGVRYFVSFVGVIGCGESVGLSFSVFRFFFFLLRIFVCLWWERVCFFVFVVRF